MKLLDKIGLIIFSNLILIINIILCALIFGWLKVENVASIVQTIINTETSSNILLALAVVLILLAIKCIFFGAEEQEINGVKDGILLKNADGELVISKATLEELTSNVVKSFESAQNVNTKIIVDKEGNLLVNVILNVTENAVIRELSVNLQNKIKSTIKKASDLQVKEVNIIIRNLETHKNSVNSTN